MEENKNFNLFISVDRLYKIKKAIGDKNPKDVENELFAKFNCYTEKEKINFEAKYIKAKLAQDEFKEVSGLESNLHVIDLILKNVDDFKLRDIPKVKRCLVLIELKYGINIGFVSEVESLFEERLQKMKMNSDYKPFDYVLNIDPENPADGGTIKPENPSDEDGTNVRRKRL